MSPLEELGDGNPGMSAELVASFGRACDAQQPGEIAHAGVAQTSSVLATDDGGELGTCSGAGHAHPVSRSHATKCCKSPDFGGYPPLHEVSIRLA